MKKILTTLLASVMVLVAAFSLAACDEIENYSVIRRMKMEIEFYDAAGEVVDTKTVEIKLYETLAEKSVEYFTKLAIDGYYDGTAISNVTSGWCEFGDYEYNANGELVKKSKEGIDTLKGEFPKNGHIVENGYTGLTATAGALIMKRKYDTNDGKSQYDTAQGAVVMNFVQNSTFDSNSYCVFGMIETDDAPKSASSSSSAPASTSVVDRTALSSLGIVKTIADLTADEKGTKTYYCETDGKYYTLSYDEDDAAHYYNGTVIADENELLDTALEDFKKSLDEDKHTFLNIPYTKVIIKSIKAK